MTTEEIVSYCLTKPGAYVDFPFGEEPLCVKVEKRLFAQVYPRDSDHKITLNCEPLAGDFYRSLYPGAVERGYHCPPMLQPHFMTVRLDGAVPDGELRTMIDLSYSTVVGKLPLKARRGLMQGEKNEANI